MKGALTTLAVLAVVSIILAFACIFALFFAVVYPLAGIGVGGVKVFVGSGGTVGGTSSQS